MRGGGRCGGTPGGGHGGSLGGGSLGGERRERGEGGLSGGTCDATTALICDGGNAGIGRNVVRGEECTIDADGGGVNPESAFWTTADCVPAAMCMAVVATAKAHTTTKLASKHLQDGVQRKGARAFCRPAFSRLRLPRFLTRL